MPKHVLMSDYEIITDGGRRRRWSSAEKLRIVEETLENGTSISVVARRNGVAANLLYRWRRLMLDGGAVAVSGDDDRRWVLVQPRWRLRYHKILGVMYGPIPIGIIVLVILLAAALLLRPF